jgi:hypothetical protein
MLGSNCRRCFPATWFSSRKNAPGRLIGKPLRLVDRCGDRRYAPLCKPPGVTPNVFEPAQIVHHQVDVMVIHAGDDRRGPVGSMDYRLPGRTGDSSSAPRIVPVYGTRGSRQRWLGKEIAMPASYPAKLLLATTLLLMPMSAFAQSGGGGGGSSGGSSGGASSGGAAGGASSGASGVGMGATAGAPNAGSAGAGNTAINGVRGPANPAGLNNSGNDPSGAGNAANTQNRLGTNSAGTANSSGSPSGTANGGSGAPRGSTTVGTAGNRAGGATGGRIDGVVTSGPHLPGDDAIKSEDSQDSKVDKKIKSICRGC